MREERQFEQSEMRSGEARTRRKGARTTAEVRTGRPPASLEALAATYRERAEEWRRLGALVSGAQIYEDVAADLMALQTAEGSELLRLREAAVERGYSVDHLSRLIRQGQIPNAGRQHAPRVRRADLPAPRRTLAQGTSGSYDVDTDARSLLGRRGGR
jgi:hypothetical protein